MLDLFKTHCVFINPSSPNPGRRKNIILIFTLLCGASKGFMKAFKAFIKPFEGPQRSTQLSEMHVVSNWTRSKWIDDA